MPMKSIYFWILSLCCIPLGFSQSIHSPLSFYGEPLIIQQTECLSENEREILKIEIQENKQKILQKNPHAFDNRGGGVLFIEPIRPKEGFNDYGYHTINYLVDHNATPNNNLLDYFCGTRTYDWASGNHAGTDYILWPYPWRRMQEGVMEIVAAADGIIVQKKDGFNDLNCVNNGNPNWNGIVLEHADGSQTIYMHFKNGGITSKEVGDAVSAGEFLGLAGSSGSSTIPHLHFEVHDQNGNTIDPFQGNCNSMNANSWWQNQEDYYVSKINRISTHYSTAFDSDCPVVENTYEELNFEYGDQLVLRLFFRDLKNDVPVDFTVIDPNGNLFAEFTWISNFGQFYATAWGQWMWNVDNTWPDGVYNVSVDFEGNTYETIFGVNTNLSMDEIEANQVTVYPNPVSDVLNIISQTPIDLITIVDIHGRTVIQKASKTSNFSMHLQGLKSGVYFAIISSEGKTTTQKIIKK